MEDFVEDKYSELILDAIDQLRKRKARPDMDRICHMLQRRHGLKNDEVNEQLTKMVNDGVVIKVDYKGNTSYRNAAKWVRTKSLFKTYFNTSDMATAVQEAVDAISNPGEAGSTTLTRCASLHDIEKYLLKRDAMCNMNIAALRSALEKEVANGRIRQVRTGEYVSVSRQEDNVKMEIVPVPDNDTGANNEKPLLPRKRLKVDDSPHIANDSVEEMCCDYCLLPARANQSGPPEDLLTCDKCRVKAHPVCLDFSEETARIVMLATWQCSDCKICSVCSECLEEEIMLICSTCDKGYHTNCLNPPVVKPSGCVKWNCRDCQFTSFLYDSGPALQNESVNTDSSLSVNSNEAVTMEESSIAVFKKCLETYPDVIPVVDRWTIEEVVTFFQYIGFTEEASAFREQEIDGASLLLMKRTDVLLGLSLKLGPALKIYKHVQILQNCNTFDGRHESILQMKWVVESPMLAYDTCWERPRRSGRFVS